MEYTSYSKELKCNLDNSNQTDDNLYTIYKNNVFGYYNLLIPDNDITLTEKVFLSLPIQKATFLLHKD